MDIISVAERFQAFAKSKTRLTLTIAALAVVLALLLRIFFENWLQTAVVTPTVTMLRTLAAEPLGALGIVLGGVLLLCTIGAFIDTSPNAAVLKDWLSRRSTPLNELRAENERIATDLRYHKWERNWGAPPPGVQRLDVHEVERAATELARLDSYLGNLGNAIERLWIALRENWIQGGDERPDFWCGKYVYDRVYSPTIRSLALLRNPGKEDHREAFKIFFENYKELRLWFHRGAAFQNRELTSFDGYSAWHAADRALFGKLNEFPNLPYMQEVREVVQGAKRDGYPSELPTLSSAPESAE